MTVPRRGGPRRDGAAPRRRPAPAQRRRRAAASGPTAPAELDPAREAALELLTAVREHDAYANLALPALLRERRLHGRDAALATELGYGACAPAACSTPCSAPASTARSTRSSRRARRPAAGRPAAAAHPDPGRTPRWTPPSSWCAPRPGRGGRVRQRGAAQGRRARRGRVGRAARAADADDPLGHSAFAHAHPRWIAQAFADALGAARAGRARRRARRRRRPPRRAPARPPRGDHRRRARAITGGEEAPYSPYGVPWTGRGDPGELAPVREGLAVVQDEGSQLVALAAARAPVTGRTRPLARPVRRPRRQGGAARGAGRDRRAAPRRRRASARTAPTWCAAPRRAAGHRAHRRRPGGRAARGRLRPGARRRPVHRAGRAAPPPEARWRRQPDDVAELTQLQRELLPRRCGTSAPAASSPT